MTDTKDAEDVSDELFTKTRTNTIQQHTDTLQRKSFGL